MQSITSNCIIYIVGMKYLEIGHNWLGFNGTFSTGYSQLLDHGGGTAFRPTCDSPTLPFISSTGH